MRKLAQQTNLHHLRGRPLWPSPGYCCFRNRAKQLAVATSLSFHAGNKVWPGSTGDPFPLPDPKFRAEMCVYTHPVRHGESPTTESIRERSLDAIMSACLNYCKDPLILCPDRTEYSITAIGLVKVGPHKSEVALVVLP